MVERNYPHHTPDLAWTGNYVTEERGLDKAVAIDSTFALSHHILFKTCILPQLLPFNQACDIANLELTYGIDNSGAWLIGIAL